MNFKELFKYTEQPKVFEAGTSNFWDDPYISSNILAAHLNPNWDAASSKQGLNIEYRYQSYLEVDYYEKYDAIMLIYCDFGALSNDNRSVLLQKIYRALKPGGVFTFDVFTEALKGDK